MGIDYRSSEELSMKEFRKWVAAMTDYCFEDGDSVFSNLFKDDSSKPVVDGKIFETMDEAVEYQLQNDELYIPLKDCKDTDIVCKNWNEYGEMVNCTIIKSNNNSKKEITKEQRIRESKSERLKEVRRLKSKGCLVLNSRKKRVNFTIHAGLWDKLGKHTSNKSGTVEMLLKKELEKKLEKTIILENLES